MELSKDTEFCHTCEQYYSHARHDSCPGAPVVCHPSRRAHTYVRDTRDVRAGEEKVDLCGICMMGENDPRHGPSAEQRKVLGETPDQTGTHDRAEPFNKTCNCPACKESILTTYGGWSEGLCELEFHEHCPSCGYHVGEQRPVPARGGTL